MALYMPDNDMPGEIMKKCKPLGLEKYYETAQHDHTQDENPHLIK
jgi:hypothetical protein